MSSRESRLGAFVDAIVRNRRPPRFPADPEDEGVLRTAARLAAARPGADLPDQTFVDSLRSRLAREMAPAEAGRRRLGRRDFLRGASVAAAAVAAGVAGDRLLLGGGESPEPQAPPGELRPEGGRWVSVAEVAALVPGRAHRFTAGAIAGYLVRNGDTVSALSAVCSHQGCMLSFDARRTQFLCPCHGAAFTLDGAPATPGYRTALTRLVHRVVDGKVEVLGDWSA